LLAAASEVFAEKGYWEATHAEICQKARANTAAINYHFGSKENLYVEAWKYAFERSFEAHPADGGVGAEAPAAQRLRGRIVAFMARVTDPDNHEIEIMHKEMANPTGLLAQVLPRVLEPMQRDMRVIVQELLGGGASAQQVSFCMMSIMGQCFAPMLHLRRGRMSPDLPRPPGPPMKFSVEELADHVVRFSLAGIATIREEARGGRKGRRHGQGSKK
jgi:AcrR family transcriptional regulator